MYGPVTKAPPPVFGMGPVFRTPKHAPTRRPPVNEEVNRQLSIARGFSGAATQELRCAQAPEQVDPTIMREMLANSSDLLQQAREALPSSFVQENSGSEGVLSDVEITSPRWQVGNTASVCHPEELPDLDAHLIWEAGPRQNTWTVRALDDETLCEPYVWPQGKLPIRSVVTAESSCGPVDCLLYTSPSPRD